MTRPNDSAFPSTTHTADGHQVNGPEYGLTKREWFAGQVLAGVVVPAWGSNWSNKEIADEAVELADALIAALTRTPKEEV